MAVKSGESRQGLIIGLVFSILLVLILGVTTYYGFDGQKKLEDDAKAAKAAEASAKSNRDWWKMQSLTWKAYAGLPLTKTEQEALPVSRGQRSSLKGDADQAEIDKQIDKLEKDLGWDDAKKVPGSTYKGRMEAALAERDATQEQLTKEKAAAAAALDTMNKQLNAAKAENAQFRKELADSKKQGTDDLQKYVAQINKQQGDLDEVGKKKAEEAKQVETQMAAKDKDLAAMKKENSGLKAALEQKEQIVTVLRGDTNPLEKDQPKGKIISIDSSGMMPFINLGSADNVKPQLTFSVYAVASDGSPTKQRKASLEVVRVVGEHLSQGRLTYAGDTTRQRDAARLSQPVVAGDLLYNPAWSPTLRQHVAVAGLVDQTGESGRESPEIQNRKLLEFLRTLEAQNMVVDAYLDLKDLKVKGEINRQTDYLILAEEPEGRVSGITKENDPKIERNNEVVKRMADIQKTAQGNAVTVISLRKFLTVTGQKPAHGAPAEGPSYNFRSIVPAAGSPVERKEPPLAEKPQK